MSGMVVSMLQNGHVHQASTMFCWVPYILFVVEPACAAVLPSQGVRSTIMPTLSQAAFEANAPVAAASAASAVAPAAFQQLHVDDDAASLGCHSIGSFSTTSSSSLSNVEGLDGLGANEAGEGNSSSGSSSSSEPINNRKLTVGALAAHTQKIATSLAAGGSAAGPQPNGSAACVAAVASAATVSSSDAAHRSGRGIRVVKKLWAAKTSQVNVQ